uniref:Sfi1 n=1 Tax=Puccinia cf. psidii AE-2014 TaxID=1505670 RepID=A0A060IHR5_9BASI|nr:Sfi1 [Puccinia cf. psidii AE-2014]
MTFGSSLASSVVTDASAHTPHGSFPILSTSDAKILNEVIEEAPKSSKLFNALIEPYNKVLARNRLDTRVDERYYSLLLKLSLVEGDNWQQRWAKICANQALEFDNLNTTAHLLALPLPSISETSANSSADDGSRTILARPSNQHPFSPPLMSHLPTSTRLSPVKRIVHPVQSTPNRMVRFSPRYRSTTLLTNEESEIDNQALGSRFIDPLDALSDRARRESLLKFFFASWKHVLSRWEAARVEVDRARVVLVCSRMWRRWRAKVGKRRREIRMVEGVAKTRSKFATLARWREATAENKRLRWKNHLIQLAQKFGAQRNQDLVFNIFTWSLKARLSSVTYSRNVSLQKSRLLQWITRHSHIRHLDVVSAQYSHQVQRSNLLNRILTHWIWRTDLKIKKNAVEQVSERNLCSQALRQWLRMACVFRLARQLYLNSLRWSWFRVWRRQRHRIKERGQLLGRVLLTRFLRAAISKWLQKLDKIRFLLDAGRQVFQKKLAKRQQVVVFKKWKDSTQKIWLRLPKLAIGRYRMSLIARHLNRWMIAFENIKLWTIRSDVTWKSLVFQRTLDIWLRRYRRSRILKLVQRKKDSLLREYFSGRLHLVSFEMVVDQKVIVVFDKKLQTVPQMRQKNSPHRSLDVYEVLIEVVFLMFFRVNKLHIHIWHGQLKWVIHLNDLANGFAEIQRIGNLFILVTFIAMTTSSLNIFFHSEQRDRMLHYWKTKAIEAHRRMNLLKKMEMLRNEYNLRQSHKQFLARESVAHWIGRSKLLPAVRFDHRRIKQGCWYHWVILLPVRQLRARAIFKDRELVLGEAFKVWWGKCTAIKASRIVAGCSRRRSRSNLYLKDFSRQDHASVVDPLQVPSWRELTMPAIKSSKGAIPIYDSTSSSGAESEQEIIEERQLEDRYELGARDEKEKNKLIDQQPSARQHEERVEAAEEDSQEDRYEEDKTIIGEASEIIKPEETSTTETEAMTESEIEWAITKMTGSRRLMGVHGSAQRQSMLYGPNGNEVMANVSSRVPNLQPSHTAAAAGNYVRSGENQVLIGLRNKDLKGRNYGPNSVFGRNLDRH